MVATESQQQQQKEEETTEWFEDLLLPSCCACLGSFPFVEVGGCGVGEAGAVLEFGGCGGPPVFARRGIVAGCSLCTTLAKVIMLQPMDRLLVLAPRVEWTLFVDDVGASTRGKEDDVVSILDVAATELREQAACIGCAIADPKTAVVASSDAAAKRLGQRLKVKTAA